MEVILIEDVPHLGGIGDLVKVAGGYGRNYLLPRKLAVLASKQSKRQLEHSKRLASFRLAAQKRDAEALVARLTAITVILQRKVGEQDKMFGSVTSRDVEQALTDQGISVDRRKIQLHEPIRELGEYKVPVRLAAGVEAEITVVVSAEA